MTSPRKVLRLPVIALVAAATLAACGGGGGGEAQTVLNDQDQSRAEAVVVRASDFPGGWTSARHEQQSAKTCLNPDLSDLTVTGQADSRDFSLQSFFVNSSATIMRSADEAKTAYERQATGDLPKCIADQLGKSIESSSDVAIDVKHTGVRELDFPRLADRSRAYRATLDLDFGGAATRAYVDFVFLQRGRTLATVAFASVGQEPQKGLDEELAARVAGRMGR